MRQFVPERSPELCLRYGVQLSDQRLHILPFWPQRLAIATTRIWCKVIETGNDLLYAGLLQVCDKLVKLMYVLFGNKKVASCSHLRLASKLDSMQALAVRAFAQHSMVVDLVCTMESKP